MLDVDLYKISTEIETTGITEAIMGSGRVGFAAPNVLDTAIRNSPLFVLTPILQEATGEALGE